MRTVILFLICIILSATQLRANIPPLNDDNAVKAIIGEAEDQGDIGMLAVACAIRNRDTLRGVFGINSPRVKYHKYSRDTLSTAQFYWDISRISEDRCNFIQGATHWENVETFGKPKWAAGMIETFRYMDHVFYREKL